ncbi:hypothetical protein DXH95_05515 [Sphingorhabdus pulchriflava]|uniref:Uncharacterized protein n=1 Tax=Sphingorhabdus pulchriflava TaxID=2292257 RepID=A0A371BGZ3_9SPHN|nr:hypothetical protein [Sphingorhabdus pulchriflava]RDV06856.1 hypothetical protein DXH95_05515 [Sphingorhabdus pulchriflava]
MMMSLALAMALNMAAMKGDALDDARKGFNNCLIAEHNEAVKVKKSAPEFNEAAQKACPAERKAYFDMLVKSERGYGSSQKDAEQYATEEIQMMVDGVTSAFGENLNSGGQLAEEK